MRGLSLQQTYPLSPFTPVNERVQEGDEFDGIFEMYPTHIKHIYMVDAGLTFNSPFPLVLRPQRGVDVILSFDFSARPSDSTPPFKVMGELYYIHLPLRFVCVFFSFSFSSSFCLPVSVPLSVCLSPVSLFLVSLSVSLSLYLCLRLCLSLSLSPSLSDSVCLSLCLSASSSLSLPVLSMYSSLGDLVRLMGR